jgi:flagellar motor switch protein FliG
MALDRYLKDDQGFRAYVELMESTASAKRKTLMDAARRECAEFVDAAEKYLFTFERITQLPSLELTEVLGASGIKVEALAVAINSVAEAAVREKLIRHVPRNLLAQLHQELESNPVPKPADIGGARLQLIKKARELEKQGRLDSMAIPRFGKSHFQKAG